MEIPHKIGNEIVNYNPRCTYYPLVPKRDTFYATDGTPLLGKIQTLPFDKYTIAMRLKETNSDQPSDW